MPTSIGSKNLRKGRRSKIGQYYLITTNTHKRLKILNTPKVAEIVLNSLYWLDSHGRIELLAAVMMPDHLHFVARLACGNLSDLMHSLKSYTANKIKAELNLKDNVWQPQYYDHAIRDDEGLKETIIYSLHNPVRTKLVNDFHTYPYWYCKYEV